MKNNFQIEKAGMAFRAQRFGECQLSYEAALDKEYSLESWKGLGIAKLHRISDDQSMKEVLYCLNKAIELYPKSKKETAIELAKNCRFLLNKYSNMIIRLDEEIAAEKRRQSWAFFFAMFSFFMRSASTTSKWSNTFSLATAGGVGYGFSKFGSINSAEEARLIVSDLIIEIHHGCDRFVKDTNQEKLPEYKAVKELEQ